MVLLILACFVKYYSEGFVNPFKQPSYRYMYVWDRSSQTPESMVQKYKDDMYKARLRVEKK